uniref:Macroglobulin domain-containing protein n=1 Tax=Haplochromis burtoni TaxID=8153 RepID=A0A3Q2VXJ6_HAPBU
IGKQQCVCLFLEAMFNFFFSVSPLLHRKVMSAPNLLGVGTAQNIFVECQDCTDESDLMVEISVMSYPTKSKMLISTSVNLNSANKFQAFGQIKVMQKYGNLCYFPYRLFALTPNMEPVERDNSTISDTSVAIQFTSFTCQSDSVYMCLSFESTGLWKVMASFQSKPQLSYSAEFEVKDYVLPNFEVKLTRENPFFYVDSDELTINIKATYLFGEEVDGSAFGVFGVLHQDQKTNFQASLQKVSIENGVGTVTLKKEHIKQTFENISSLVGSSIFAAVNVLTDSGKKW